MVLAPLSARFQLLPPLPTIKLGPSGADSRVGGWACACCRPLWVSPTSSPVRLGVSLAATSTPRGVFNQRFEVLFPHSEALGCAVCLTPQLLLLVYLLANVGLPSLPASPLLRVLSSQLPISTPPTGLKNVSSLTPWLLDFHKVQFPVSSGCFLFLYLSLSFYWLCEEAQCVYLCLHLGRKCACFFFC